MSSAAFFTAKNAAGPDGDLNLPPIRDWNEFWNTLSGGPNVGSDAFGLRHDFGIDFHVDGQPLSNIQLHLAREGKAVDFSIRSDVACYVAVYSIGFDHLGAAPVLVQLYPTASDRSILVQAKTPTILFNATPDADESFAYLHVLASNEPLAMGNTVVFDTAEKRGEWESLVRGYRRLGQLSEMLVSYRVEPVSDPRQNNATE